MRLTKHAWYILIYKCILAIKYKIIRLQSADPNNLSNKENPSEGCLNFTKKRKQNIHERWLERVNWEWERE